MPTKMKPCPDCAKNGAVTPTQIPEDQGSCWPCWHRFLLDTFDGRKQCVSAECPVHGRAQRSLLARFKRWWRWRGMRRHSARMDRLEREQTGRGGSPL